MTEANNTHTDDGSDHNTSKAIGRLKLAGAALLTFVVSFAAVLAILPAALQPYVGIPVIILVCVGFYQGARQFFGTGIVVSILIAWGALTFTNLTGLLAGQTVAESSFASFFSSEPAEKSVFADLDPDTTTVEQLDAAMEAW